jgi:hypothetical protein
MNTNYSVNLSVFVKETRLWVMVFHATFNNISAISWQSVSLVEKTEIPGENHQRAAKETKHAC